MKLRTSLDFFEDAVGLFQFNIRLTNLREDKKNQRSMNKGERKVVEARQRKDWKGVQKKRKAGPYAVASWSRVLEAEDAELTRST